MEPIGGRKLKSMATIDSAPVSSAGPMPPYHAASVTAAMNGRRIGSGLLPSVSAAAQASSVTPTATPYRATVRCHDGVSLALNSGCRPTKDLMESRAFVIVRPCKLAEPTPAIYQTKVGRDC